MQTSSPEHVRLKFNDVVPALAGGAVNQRITVCFGRVVSHEHSEIPPTRGRRCQKQGLGPITEQLPLRVVHPPGAGCGGLRGLCVRTWRRPPARRQRHDLPEVDDVPSINTVDRPRPAPSAWCPVEEPASHRAVQNQRPIGDHRQVCNGLLDDRLEHIPAFITVTISSRDRVIERDV